MRELKYYCQKMGERMPGRPKQTMTTPISSVISSSWQIELFKLFKLFGWFSIHLPLNCMCHLFPNETRNLGSQFPYKKALLCYVHRHSVFSKAEMTEDSFSQGWENIWMRICYFSSSVAFWQGICYNIFCSWIMDCCLPIVFINTKSWLT